MSNTYPRMIYNADGRTHILQAASSPRPEGQWSDEPHAIHREARADHHTTRAEEPDQALAHAVADILVKRLVDEGYVAKRGPGRPPKSETDKGVSDAGE